MFAQDRSRAGRFGRSRGALSFFSLLGSSLGNSAEEPGGVALLSPERQRRESRVVPQRPQTPLSPWLLGAKTLYVERLGLSGFSSFGAVKPTGRSRSGRER
jgi:hypothetical protein